MRKFILGSAAAAVASSQLLFKGADLHSLLGNTLLANPHINIYENFQADLHVYTYNSTSQELEPHMNMTGTEYYEATANRYRVDLWLTSPYAGYVPIV